jgi:hypothetical protein
VTFKQQNEVSAKTPRQKWNWKGSNKLWPENEVKNSCKNPIIGIPFPKSCKLK